MRLARRAGGKTRAELDVELRRALGNAICGWWGEAAWRASAQRVSVGDSSAGCFFYVLYFILYWALELSR